MSSLAPKLPATDQIGAAEVDRAKGDLAAAFRIAAEMGLNEGIDNHLSYAFGDGTFLVNRYGPHWSRICKTDILRIDFEARVLEGSGRIDNTAFYIHEAIHRLCPDARAVFHTHQPYATALACVEGGRLEPISQVALMFHGRTAYIDEYGGMVLDRAEGERLARAVGDAVAVFLANHGVITIGNSIAGALHDLYFLERAAMIQILAAQSGGQLKPLPATMIEHTQRQIVAEVHANHDDFFEAHKELLAGREPDYLS